MGLAGDAYVVRRWGCTLSEKADISIFHHPLAMFDVA
jgi:hypothetical protein